MKLSRIDREALECAIALARESGTRAHQRCPELNGNSLEAMKTDTAARGAPLAQAPKVRPIPSG
jgi:hypothetical protein